MKLKSSHFFFFFSMIFFGSLSIMSAMAQEENDPAVNEYKETNQNLPDLVITDEKSVADHDHTSKVRDSVHIRSLAPLVKVKSADQAKPSSSKEDDALSFNFLYYIIQKFKISDLVDD